MVDQCHSQGAVRCVLCARVPLSVGWVSSCRLSSGSYLREVSEDWYLRSSEIARG